MQSHHTGTSAGNHISAGGVARTDNSKLQFIRSYARNRMALFGAVIIALLSIIALLAPILAPMDPYAMSRTTFAPPGINNRMGTDNYGRDTFSGILYGTRVSLIVGLSAALISVVLGVTLGALSGYFGGGLDTFLMRLTELFQMIPRFFLALVIVALTGKGIIKLVFVIGILSWPPTARLVRAQFLSLREQGFVEAGRAQGFSHAVLIFREILPNAMPPAIVQATLDVGQAILLEANLSFFGLGDPSTLSWGTMLHNAQKFLLSGAWWLSISPGFCIFITVLAFNLVGDGLHNALNPRLK